MDKDTPITIRFGDHAIIVHPAGARQLCSELSFALRRRRMCSGAHTETVPESFEPTHRYVRENKDAPWKPFTHAVHTSGMRY